MASMLPLAFLAVALQEQNRPETSSYGPGVFILLFILFRTLFSNSNPGSSPFDETQEVECLIHEGHYPEAEKKLRKLIRATEREQGIEGIGVAVYVRRLAQLKHQQQQLAEAETLYRRVLDIQEKNLGAASPDLIPTLNSLAVIASANHNEKAFMSALQRGLRIRSLAYGDDDIGSADVWNHMGVYAFQHQQFEVAEEYFRRALGIVEKAEKPLSAESIFSSNLADSLRQRGQLEEAEACYLRAIRIGEVACGQNDLNLVPNFLNAADLELRLSRPEIAEANLRRALQMVSQGQQQDHDQSKYMEADALDLLARSLEMQGRQEESLETNRLRLGVLDGFLAPDHVIIGVAVGWMGRQLLDLGRLDEAEPLLRRAIDIAEKSSDAHAAEFISTMSLNLGILLRHKGDLAEAERVLWRGIEAGDKAFGPENLSSSLCLSNVAEVRSAQGNLESAETFFRKVLEVQEKLLKPNDVLIAKTLVNLGIGIGKRSAFEEEEGLLRRALLIFQATGAQDKWVLKATHALAECLFQRGRLDEAETECRRALEISTRVFGEANLETATTISALARVLSNKGNFSEARTLLTRAYNLFTKLLGPEHNTSIFIKERLDQLSFKAAATKAN